VQNANRSKDINSFETVELSRLREQTPALDENDNTTKKDAMSGLNESFLVSDSKKFVSHCMEMIEDLILDCLPESEALFGETKNVSPHLEDVQCSENSMWHHNYFYFTCFLKKMHPNIPEPEYESRIESLAFSNGETYLLGNPDVVVEYK
jgi:hypothetical protein